MFSKKSLLLLACLVIDTFAFPYQEPIFFDEIDNFSPYMGFSESEYNGFFDEYLPPDTDEFKICYDFDPTFDEHDQFFDNECYNEFETYCKDLRFITNLETQMDYFTTTELIDILFRTMPNIPEHLINFIAQTDAGFIDYIFRMHKIFEGLGKKMDACTVERFCKDVPFFGEKLGELSEEILKYLISKYPGLGKCIVITTATSNTTTIYAIPEPTTDETVTKEEQ
ncbi:hypothetical protein ACTXT7_009452 [Hymenolepis weldensis]